MAAVVLIAVGYLTFQERFHITETVDHYYQVVHDHLNCQELEDDTLPLPIEEARVAIALSGVEPVRLAAAHRCRFKDVEFFHFAYETQGGKGPSLSLILEERSRGQRLARLPESEVLLLGDIRIQVGRRDEVSLATFESDRFFVYVATEERDRPLARQALAALLADLRDVLPNRS